MGIQIHDPEDPRAVISAQRAELQRLQAINPKVPIRIKIREGKTPEGEDPDLYRWLPYPNIWNKVDRPIYTRGILANEILIDPDTENWQAMKAGVEKLSDYCQQNNIPIQKGFSGGKGVHCSIIIGNIPLDTDFVNKIKDADIDAYKTVRRALFFALMERAGVKPVDIAVDMLKINFNAESKGSQVRTFGTTRAPGLYKTLIETIPDHKPEPNELPLIFPDKVDLWEIGRESEFYHIVITALEKEAARAKKANEYPLADVDFAGSKIMDFPCIKNLYEAGLKHGRYYAGEAVLLMCKKCGISKEEAVKHMRELYRTFPTISSEETDLYIGNALSMYEPKNFSCRALKELYPDLKLCDFSRCPLKSKLNENGQKAKKQQGTPEKVRVYFDEVADRILKEAHIFTMRDTSEMYMYSDGVYTNDGTKTFLETRIRRTQQQIFREKWNEVNPGIDLPEHITKATKNFVNEAIAYIQAFTYVFRESLEAVNSKYLNFTNCLFNLDTWETEDHTPEKKCITQIPVEYNPEARCPKIAKFLSDVAKPEDVPFLLEWAGYCLTPFVMHQKSLMVYGIPGTGKSVLLALLEALIGKMNCSAESLQKLEEDKYRCANLYGKRVNICSDIPSTRMHKTEMFKRLTSGLDTIDAEKKYVPSFNFKNTAKLTFSANKLPEGPKDPAFYERFCLIEFPNKIRGTEKDDKRLIGKLTEPRELSGFLNLALEGLKRLKDSDQFSYSKSFEQTEKEYLLNSNPVAYFMANYTVTSPDDVDSTELYISFIKWCNSQNLPMMVKSVFGKALSRLGYDTYRDYIGGKRPTFVSNVAIKKDELDQITFENGQANRQAGKICLSIGTDSEKTDFGQATIPFVENYLRNETVLLKENITETVENKQVQGTNHLKCSEEKKIFSNNKEFACPNQRFFDSGIYGQANFSFSEFACPTDGSALSKQEKFPDSDPIESIEYLEKLNFLKNEIKTFNSTWLRKNGGIDDIGVFYGAFKRAYPGFLQTFPEGLIVSEIKKVCKRTASEHTKANVVNVKATENYDLYIGRAYQTKSGKWVQKSKWNNPFRIGKDGTREEVIQKYVEYFWAHPELIKSLPELKGKILGCWCNPEPCHGDYLARLASDTDFFSAEQAKYQNVSDQEDSGEVEGMVEG